MHRSLLLFTACLLGLFSTIGAALPYPILPPLFAADAPSTLNHFLGLPGKLLFGIALAINPLGLLIGSALLGPLSDHYGRRRILLITSLACAAGHALTAWALLAQSYPLFILARFATGLAEGNAPVARAMLADKLEGAERVKGLAVFNSALYMGWLVGPLLAGLTLGFGLTVPFWTAVAAMLLAAALVVYVLPAATLPTQPHSWWQQARNGHALKLLAHADLRKLFVLQLAFTLGLTAFYEYYPLWLVEFAGQDARGIAWTTAGLCLLMTASSSLAGRPARLAPLPRAAFYAAVCALVYLLLIPGLPMLGMAAIVLAGLPIAFYNAIMPAYCAERFGGQYGQGAVMGLLATIFCIANILVAIMGAGLTLLDTRLILALGALSALWSAWRLLRWHAGRTDDALSLLQKPGVEVP